VRRPKIRFSRPTKAVVATLIVLGITTPAVAFAASLNVGPSHLTAFTKTYGSTTTCTLTASADTFVQQDNATGNFGTQNHLDVKSDSTKVRRAFVQFTLSSCSPAIPSTAIVRSATLKLVTNNKATATRTYQAFLATSTWTETGVTWNTQPSVAASATTTAAVAVNTASGTTVQWTTTGDVQAWFAAASTNFGWRVNDSQEGVTPNTTLTFDSREVTTAANRPQLVITYVS
jgi:hyaluronate lyase